MNAAHLRVVLVAVLACALVAPPAAGTAGVAADRTAAPPAVDGRAGPAASDGHVPGVGAGRVPSTGANGAAGAATTGQSSTLGQVQELRLTPGRPGEVTVALTYGVPDRVTRLSTELPADATVVSTRGFRHEEGTRYAWTGGTDRPSVTYRLPANDTTETSGPIGDGGGYRFVDVGSWALVRVPGVGTSWGWTGSPRVSLEREWTTAGAGAVGEAVAFLGEHRVHEHEAHGQRFRLVVPAAATLRESPDDVVAALAGASDVLRVGDRDDEVFLVAAPTGVEWGVRGLQAGDADGWVRADERLDDRTNVWVHEYVHTRQSWTTTDATRWTTEATATHYAALLALERGAISYDAFLRQLESGTYSPQAEAVLARPATWRNAAQYQKGGLVAADLDRRIRLATDGRRSLQHVLRAMNERGDPVTGEAFLRQVEDAGGGSVREAGERYTTTEAVPSPWIRSKHVDAFGSTPAYVEYELAGRHEVAGPYRNATVGAPTVTVVPGETLTVAAGAYNAGGAADEYEATFRVDGEPVANATGRVEAGERVPLSFSHAFDEVGAHTVAVGDAELAVEVVRPARAAVTDVAVDRSTVEAGEAVTLTATVRNDAAVPGTATVSFRVDGRTVATRDVRLGPGETRTASATTTFDAAGTYRVDVGGDDAVTVSVEGTPTPSPTPTTADGLGVLAALVALAGLLAAGRQR